MVCIAFAVCSRGRKAAESAPSNAGFGQLPIDIAPIQFTFVDHRLGAVLHVLQARGGEHGHHRSLDVLARAHGVAQSGQAGRAGQFLPLPVLRQRIARGDDCGIVHRQGEAAAFADRQHAAIAVDRDHQAGGDARPRLDLDHRLAGGDGARQRPTRGGFGRADARHAIGQAEQLQFAKALPHAKQHLACAGRQDHRARHLAAEIEEDLVGDGLVAFRPERMAGVEARQVADRMEAGARDQIAQHRPARIGRHGDQRRAIGLDELLEHRRHGRAGDDDAFHAGARGIGCGRGAVIARRCDRDTRRARRHRRADGAQVEPVLVAPGRVAALILDIELALQPGPLCDARHFDQRRTALAHRQTGHQRRQQRRPAIQARQRRLFEDRGIDLVVTVSQFQRKLLRLGAGARAARGQHWIEIEL